jgi:hypothetical protein
MPFGPIGGRGCWCHGWWGGRGWRHWYYATCLPGWMRARLGYPAFGGWAGPGYYGPATKEELAILKEQAEILKEQLEYVQNRIRTLEKTEEQK